MGWDGMGWHKMVRKGLRWTGPDWLESVETYVLPSTPIPTSPSCAPMYSC